MLKSGRGEEGVHSRRPWSPPSVQLWVPTLRECMVQRCALRAHPPARPCAPYRARLRFWALHACTHLRVPALLAVRGCFFGRCTHALTCASLRSLSCAPASFSLSSIWSSRFRFSRSFSSVNLTRVSSSSTCLHPTSPTRMSQCACCMCAHLCVLRARVLLCVYVCCHARVCLCAYVSMCVYTCMRAGAWTELYSPQALLRRMFVNERAYACAPESFWCCLNSSKRCLGHCTCCAAPYRAALPAEPTFEPQRARRALTP